MRGREGGEGREKRKGKRRREKGERERKGDQIVVRIRGREREGKRGIRGE